MKLRCVSLPLALIVLEVLTTCLDGIICPTFEPPPPPRCLQWVPNQANQPKNCIDLPNQSRPEVDIDKMIYEFQKNKWDRNHY